MLAKPSLLDELGLDEQTLSWRQLALCKGMLPEKDDSGTYQDLFYEAYEADEEIAKAMDEVCLSCPVFKDCLMEATDLKDSGLHGAIFLNNGKPDKNANKHKTEEVWSRIQEKLR